MLASLYLDVTMLYISFRLQYYLFSLCAMQASISMLLCYIFHSDYTTTSSPYVLCKPLFRCYYALYFIKIRLLPLLPMSQYVLCKPPFRCYYALYFIKIRPLYLFSLCAMQASILMLLCFIFHSDYTTTSSPYLLCKPLFQCYYALYFIKIRLLPLLPMCYASLYFDVTMLYISLRLDYYLFSLCAMQASISMLLCFIFH